jgi:trehalose 6-phosphate phosphatase
MQYALSIEGTQALHRLRGRRLLAAFDFDGTLAPLALHPHLVVTPPGTGAALERLRHVCMTAIISGRERADVAARVGVPVDHVIGNHGIDGLPGAERELAECIEVTRGWMKQLHNGEAIHAIDPGLMLENKRVSLSVHFRQARDAEHARGALPALFGRLEPPPRIVNGKKVFNLLPPAAVDKGTALLRLLELTRAEAGLYVGDDATDEDVFRLHQPDLLTIRVGRDETSLARYYLRAPSEMPRLIEALIAAIGVRPAMRRA